MCGSLSLAQLPGIRHESCIKLEFLRVSRIQTTGFCYKVSLSHAVNIVVVDSCRICELVGFRAFYATTKRHHLQH